MKKNSIVIAIVIAVAALVGGCRGASSTHSITPQQKASVSALASVPGADAQQILISKGVPINGTSAQQIAWFSSMFSLKHPVQAKANRAAFYKNLDIPPQNMSAFEATLLAAAKSDHVITSHDGKVKFLTIDLPNAYQVAVS